MVRHATPSCPCWNHPTHNANYMVRVGEVSRFLCPECWHRYLQILPPWRATESDLAVCRFLGVTPAQTTA